MNDFQRWKQKGLIDENLAQILSQELKGEQEKTSKLAIQIALYTIGAILIAIGVISFIAGNNWILRLFDIFPTLKEILLLILTVGVFFEGYRLKYVKNAFIKLADSLIFLSTLLIGANYMLIWQMYHWDTNSLIYSLWFLSIYPLALMFKSKAINRVSLILFVCAFCYLYFELAIDKIDAWTVILPFSLCGILYSYANFPSIRRKYPEFAIDYKIVSLVSVFFILLVLTFTVNPSYYLPYLCYIIVPVIVMAGALINLLTAKQEEIKLLSHETIFLFALSLFEIILLYAHDVSAVLVTLIAHFFIIYIISCLIFWGYTLRNNSLVTLANWFLLIYILCVYSRIGWNYLDKTLFFLIGGVISVRVGMYLEKEKKTRIQKQ